MLDVYRVRNVRPHSLFIYFDLKDPGYDILDVLGHLQKLTPTQSTPRSLSIGTPGSHRMMSAH